MKLKFLIITLFLLLSPLLLKAAFVDNYAGKFILNKQKDNSLWFVNAGDKKKYPLYRADDIAFLAAKIGSKIEEVDFQKIAQSNMPVTGDKNIAKKFAGRIIKRTDDSLWYVNPKDLKKYFLGNGFDTFKSLKDISEPLNYYDFSRIHKPGMAESINQYSSFEQKDIITESGKKFKVNIVSIDLDNPKLKIITDTADSGDCTGPCRSKSVSDFVLANKGFAGLNGTYFEPGAKKKNYTFSPVFKSNNKFLTNKGQLKYWTTGPVIAFDTDNNFYYFGDSRDFAKALSFKDKNNNQIIIQNNRTGVLQAAMSNNPKLIAEGQSYLIDWAMDKKQRESKSIKNAISYQAETGSKGKLMLISVSNATVIDLSETLTAMKIDYALNIDGGGSTGLYYNEEYMLGPGCNVPNAIVFSEI